MLSINSMEPACRCAVFLQEPGLVGTRTLDNHAPRLGNRFRGTALGDFPVPLPKDYLIGLDSQKSEEENGFLRLSGGRLVRGGRWYDPFLVLGQKLPLGTLLLLGAALAFALSDLRHPTLTLWAVWLPALFLLGLFCCQTGLNWIVRYQLILFPFLFIGVGRLVDLARSQTWLRPLIAACIVWNAGALFWTRPSYLSYGNELVGGPDRGAAGLSWE